MCVHSFVKACYINLIQNGKGEKQITQKLVVSVLKCLPLTQFLFFVYVKKNFSQVTVFRGDIEIFMQPLFRHFDTALRFES